MLKKLMNKLHAKPPCPCETLGPVDDETWEALVKHKPNWRTRRTFRRTDAGKGLTRYESPEAIFKHLGIQIENNRKGAD